MNLIQIYVSVKLCFAYIPINKPKIYIQANKDFIIKYGFNGIIINNSLSKSIYFGICSYRLRTSS